MPTSIGGKRPAKSKAIKPKSSKATTIKSTTGGYNLAPLVSALLLAGIRLSLEQNKKLSNKSKASTPKRKTKSTPRPNTV